MKIQDSLKTDKNNGYFTHEDRYTDFITSHSVLLRMRDISDKSCTGNQNTHFIFSIFFFSKIVPFMKQSEKKIPEWGWQQLTIWRMRISCWTPNAKNTPPEYVIFHVFPLQQWLRKRASMLRYPYCACLVCVCVCVCIQSGPKNVYTLYSSISLE